MLTYLKKTGSLSNLGCHQLKGQIATLLMLLMVAVLIFILITVNLARVSLTSTRVSNVADYASLRLASRLATQSKRMYDAIKDIDGGIDEHGEIRKCKIRGALPIIAAVIVAIIVTILTWGTQTHWVICAFYAAFAAAAASAVTTAMMGGSASEIGWGAINGFMIGFSIGSMTALSSAKIAAVAASHAGKIGAAAAAKGAAAAAKAILMDFTVAEATQIGATATSAATSAAIAAITAKATMIAVMGFLSAASRIYRILEREAAISQAISEICRKIPEPYTALREDVFYAALSQLVDDPRREKDGYDIDKDGDTEETVSYFDNRFYERAKQLQSDMISNSATNFFLDIVDRILGTGSNTIRGFLTQIDRKEVECTASGCSGGAEGPVVELLRKLKTKPDGSNYKTISFWQPGPDRDALLIWYNQECEACSAPSGFDSVDYTHKEYEDFIDATEVIQRNWEHRMEHFEEYMAQMEEFWERSPNPPEEPNPPEPRPAGATNFYTTLGYILDGDSTQSPQIIGMTGWISWIQAVREELPRCQLVYNTYTPNRSTKDTDNPCGDPYTPGGSNPFYPCAWKKLSSDNSPTEGTNFPNYPCRLALTPTTDEKSNLTTQLNSISTFVQNLPEHIRNDPANSSLFAPGTCASPSVSDGNPPTITITITNIQLDNSGEQGPYYTGSPNTTDSRITYTFNYEVSWTCVDTTPDPDVYTYPSKSGTKTKTEQLPGVRDVVEITAANSVEAFLVKVNNMQSKLSGIQPTAQDPFATIDGDIADEFMPVISTLVHQTENIEALRFRMETYAGSDSVTDKPDNGKGELTYEWTRPNPSKPELPYRYAVTVKTGPFRYPVFINYKTGNWAWGKKCMKVYYYCDNMSGIANITLPTEYTTAFASGSLITAIIPFFGYMGGGGTYTVPVCPYNDGRTWVSVAKTEPANKDIPRSILGKWNPFRGKNSITITKKSFPYFSFFVTGIAKIRE